MHYDIEADWLLLLTCNFRCRYCFIEPRDLGAPVVPAGRGRCAQGAVAGGVVVVVTRLAQAVLDFMGTTI